MLIIALGSLLGMVLSQVFFAIALELTSPVTMSLFGALGPIVVLLLSALLSFESITPKKALGVIIGISGTAFVVLRNRNSGPSSISVLGICFAIISITSYSSYIVIMRKIAGKFTPVTIMKWMYLYACLFLAPFAVPELPQQRIFFISGLGLLPYLQLAYPHIITSIVGGILMPMALKRVRATTVSMYSNIQPLTASTAAIIVGQDQFSWDKPLTLVLIIFGVYLVSQRETEIKKAALPKAK